MDSLAGGTARATAQAVDSMSMGNSGETHRRLAQELGEFRVVAECNAVDAHLGGDFYYAAIGALGRLAVVIGDGSGHGAEGAKVLSELLPMLPALVRPGAGPGSLLAELNRQMAERLPVDRFVTAFALEIDARAGLLVAANAGHGPALLRRASGVVSLIGQRSGPPLGPMSGVTYVEERARIGAGDVLVFMTDGVLEAVEPDLLRLGSLQRAIARVPVRRVHSSVGHLLDGLALARDDQMLVSVELLRRRSECAPS